MIIENNLKKRGFSISLFKDASITYPEGVWEEIDIDVKKALIENIAYLKVSPYAMFLDKEIMFNFPFPYLKDFGDKGVLKDIPRVAEEDNISTKELIKKFQNKKVSFNNDAANLIKGDTDEGAVIGISLGKDSLLSYALSKEMELKTRLVFVQDCWDTEIIHKLSLMRRFEEEFNEKIEIVYDEIDDISTYKRINKTNSEGIVGSNAMNGYLLMLIPFAFKYKVNKIIFGNEQNFNDFFVNKEGFKVYPSYEQCSEWMAEQNKALDGFTGGKVKINSFIEPIYNIAEFKVLFNRYPSIAKYQMSCSLVDVRSRKERWCYSCPMCAKTFLYLVANGADPKTVSFGNNFFNKEYWEFYPLFNKDSKRIYEKPEAVRDEQLLAFYMAHKNNAKGYLMEKFKKKFLDEAKKREDELYNKFFKVYDAASLSGKLKQDINSIYREELNK